MSSVRSWRNFVRQRLSAAAEDTFTALESSISRCEQQIARQRRMLDVALKPEVKVHRIDLPQHKRRDDVAPPGHQEEIQTVQIKEEEEEEELCSSVEGEPGMKTHIVASTSAESHKESLKRRICTKASKKNSRGAKHPAGNNHCKAGSGFLAHTRTHRGERPHTCKDCGKTFGRSDKLLLHTRTHTGEKPYLCNVCGKSVTDPSAFKRHLTIHTDAKLHSCDTCGKSFRHSNTLLCHVRSHTGERPYLCKLCGHRFVNASKLQRHTKTHTNEKPHACDMCGKRFIRPARLRNHMRVHTGEKPYACTSCGKAFSCTSSLKSHMKTHEGHIFAESGH